MVKKEKKVKSNSVEKPSASKGEQDVYNKQLEALKKKYGDNIIQTIVELEEKPIVSYSTGSLGLDYIISPEAGGIPQGRLIELYGDYSTGKSTLTVGYCSNVTANGKIVLYIDTEKSLKPSLINNSGATKDMITIIRSRDGSATADMISSLIKNPLVGAVVVDSVANWRALPKDDVDYGNPRVGAHARFISAVLPEMVDLCYETDTPMILINQMRTKIDTNRGASTVSSSCHSLDHNVSIKIRLRGKAQQTSYRIFDPSTSEVIGQHTTCMCEKNKYDMPFREVTLPIIFGKGVNPYMELSNLAIQRTDLIEVSGSWLKWADSGKTIVQGVDNFAQMLYNDSGMYRDVREEVIKVLGIRYSKDLLIKNSYIDEYGNKTDSFEKEEQLEEKGLSEEGKELVREANEYFSK